MIKKILFTSLILCEVMCFFGCDNGVSEPVNATVESQSVFSDTTDESTQPISEQPTEPTSEPVSEPMSEPISEPASKYDPEHPPVSKEDVLEQFENYTIKKIYVTMSSSAGVNVRKGPSEEYARINGIAKEQAVNVVGQCVETGWYMIELDGIIGFVTNQFLTLHQDNNHLVLGDECPYEMYIKTEHNGQQGWFYRTELGWQPLEYKKILEEMTNEGYTVEKFPVYVGTWRDVGDVMWFGYVKN